MSDTPGIDQRRDLMFLQTQFMPWKPYIARGAGASRRLLNQNPATGAETFVLKLAAGYKLDASFVGADFEFYVVDGAVDINGLHYVPHCYGMHPAGYAHHTFSSPRGAVLIVITTGGPDRADRGSAQLAVRRERLAEFIDVTTIPWFPGVDPVLLAPHSHLANLPIAERRDSEPGTFTKVIWEDPDTKGHTFIKGDLPHVRREPQNVRSHSVSSEYFVIEGDYIIADEGRMLPGAYFSWEANKLHGPSACEFIAYTLAKYYGQIAVNPSKEKRIVSLDLARAPTLPSNLQEFARTLPYPDPWS